MSKKSVPDGSIISKDDLRAKIEESRKDGRTKPAEEVFDHLEAKYQKLGKPS